MVRKEVAIQVHVFRLPMLKSMKPAMLTFVLQLRLAIHSDSGRIQVILKNHDKNFKIAWCWIL